MIDISVPDPFFAITETEIESCFGEIEEMDHGFKYEGLEHVTVDIVTGYTDPENPLVFWIPDKRNDNFVWIETSPDASEERIKDANRLTNGRAGKYVRLMKYWNIVNEKCYNSFHLETLVVKKLLTDSEKFNKLDFDMGVHYLFQHLDDEIGKKEPQPSKRGPKLGDISEEKKRKIQNVLGSSISLSGEAWMLHVFLNNWAYGL